MSKLTPNTFTLDCNTVERITCKQACNVLPPLAEGEGAIHYNSGPMGPPQRQWLEVIVIFPQGRYSLAFGVKDRIIQALWAVITPSGKSFSIDHEGSGNPAQYVKIETYQALTRLLLPSQGIIKLRPLWRLEIDDLMVGQTKNLGTSPKGLKFPNIPPGATFTDEETAEKIMGEFKAYWADCLTVPPKDVQKPKKVTKKAAAAEANK